MSSLTLSGQMRTRIGSSLKTRLMLAFMVTAAVPIVFVAGLLCFQASRTLERNLFEYLEGMSGAKAQTITASVRAMKQEVATAAVSMRLAASMAHTQNATFAEGAESRGQLVDNLNRILRGKEEFEEVFVVSSSGTILESTSPDNNGRDVGGSIYFKQGSQKTYVESGMSAEGSGEYRAVIASPIKDAGGERLGVLAARLNLAPLFEIVTDVTGLRRTGLSYVGAIVDDQARILSPLRNETQSTAKTAVGLGSVAAVPIRDAVRGRNGQGIVPDYRGTSVVAVWLHIPEMGWGLVTKIDLEEFREPLRAWMIQVCFMGLFVLVITGIGAHLLTGKIVRPIVALTDAAERFSRREADVKIDISSEDEIGKLAASFSRMVAAIKFFKEMGEEKP